MQQLHIPGDQDQVKSKRITFKLSTTNTHIAEPLLRFFLDDSGTSASPNSNAVRHIRQYCAQQGTMKNKSWGRNLRNDPDKLSRQGLAYVVQQ